MKDFSMLISVYKNEKAEHLKQCFDSVAQQTLQPTEIVLVEDGPLTPQINEAIEQEQQRFNNIIRVKLERNSGLGTALREGLKVCHYDIVARMDADDICQPQRFELQMQHLEAHPDVDVISSWIAEFYDSPDNIIAIRDLPEEHADIYEFGKIRNPINHPAVMFRRQAVIDAGSYQPFPLFEDYYLWARMLNGGNRFHNIQQPLLLFRRSSQMMHRRGGWRYAKNEILFQRALHEMGYITAWRMTKNIILRYGIRLVPNSVRSWIYSRFLRRQF